MNHRFLIILSLLLTTQPAFAVIPEGLASFLKVARVYSLQDRQKADSSKSHLELAATIFPYLRKEDSYRLTLYTSLISTAVLQLDQIKPPLSEDWKNTIREMHRKIYFSIQKFQNPFQLFSPHEKQVMLELKKLIDFELDQRNMPHLQCDIVSTGLSVDPTVLDSMEKINAFYEKTYGHNGKGTPTLLEVNPKFSLPLYQIVVPGKNRNISILGTQHNLPLNVFPEEVKNIASQAHLLVGEVDVNPEESPLQSFTPQKMRDLGLLSETGFHWFDKISNENRTFLNDHLLSHLKSFGVQSFDELHPAAVAQLLSRSVSAHYQGEGGIDWSLRSLHKNAGKPYQALENELDRMETTYLPKILEEKEAFRFTQQDLIQFDAKIQTYRQLLNSKYDNSLLLSRDLYDYAYGEGNTPDSAVIARNHRWIEKMDQIIEQTDPSQSILFMVGRSHLHGAAGILDLLKAKGYRIDGIRR